MEPFASMNIKYKLVNDEVHETPMNVYSYSDKSVALTFTEHFGKSFIEHLKELGKYNPKLKDIGKGWIFAKSKYENLQQLIGKISSYEIKGVVPTVYGSAPISTDFFKNVGAPPEIVTLFQTLIFKLQNITDLNVASTETERYLYGPSKEVDRYLNDYSIKSKFRLDLNEKSIAVYSLSEK